MYSADVKTQIEMARAANRLLIASRKSGASMDAIWSAGKAKAMAMNRARSLMRKESTCG